MSNNLDAVQVLDLETSVKNRGDEAVGKNKASPHYPKNQVVWCGVKNAQTGTVLITERPEHVEKDFPAVPDILVGQNIKFDLLYLMRNKKFRNVQLPKMRVWDTMLAEYLITGQQSKMISLDKLATQYGGTLKDDRLKEMWNAGVDTEDIDESLIKPYLENDLHNTEIVFRGQIKLANELGMMPLIKSQMDALLATTEMEYNGMYFDKVGAMYEAKNMRIELDTLDEALVAYMSPRLPHLDVADVMPSSAQQVSLCLFGGEVKTRKAFAILAPDGSAVLYKSGPREGQQKTKLQDHVEDILGSGVAITHTTPTKRSGIYAVNDEVLKAIIATYPTGHYVHSFCMDLLRYRELSKDLNTYYIGYSDLVWAHDSCIHPNLNHCVTATGRLSGSSPNIQNCSHDRK